MHHNLFMLMPILWRTTGAQRKKQDVIGAACQGEEHDKSSSLEQKMKLTNLITKPLDQYCTNGCDICIQYTYKQEIPAISLLILDPENGISSNQITYES